MAEVLDIITRLQYEANTAGLDKSISTIEKEIKSIDELKEEKSRVIEMPIAQA